MYHYRPLQTATGRHYIGLGLVLLYKPDCYVSVSGGASLASLCLRLRWCLSCESLSPSQVVPLLRVSLSPSQVVPLLRVLYTAQEKNSHHIYMALIVLLILSEDNCFNEAVHKTVRLDHRRCHVDRIALRSSSQICKSSKGLSQELAVVKTV